jgi:NAD(P)-dependent dehydrogenase (short-subunit alcohol dehydrogenase family)
VVTGGASGIGFGLATTLLERGAAAVALVDVELGALEDAVARLRAADLGGDVIGLHCDVTDATSVELMAAAAWQELGSVQVVCLNAGVFAGGAVWETTEADWDWVLGVNLRGVINGVRVFTPLMLDVADRDPSYEGHIVNTASMAGLLTAPAMGVYGVSKHAVVALSEALYQDLSLVTDRVRCSVLCPSYVSTAIGKADRNRPQHLANETPMTPSQLAARAVSENSIASGGMSAGEVSRLTFEAVREGRFHVFPHPEALALVRRRFENIVAQRNPTLTFEDVPSLNNRRERLIEAIRGQIPASSQ